MELKGIVSESSWRGVLRITQLASLPNAKNVITSMPLPESLLILSLAHNRDWLNQVSSTFRQMYQAIVMNLNRIIIYSIFTMFERSLSDVILTHSPSLFHICGIYVLKQKLENNPNCVLGLLKKLPEGKNGSTIG
jgi:hypothetical protein